MQIVFQKIGAWLLIVLLATAIVSAQPGYVEEQGTLPYRTLEEIKKLDAKIRSSPGNADFHNARGVLYLHLFLKYGSTVEYEKVVYAAGIEEKSIEDLNLAVSLNPKAEFFLHRGRFYEKLWLDETGDLGFSQSRNWMGKDNPPVSWEVIEAKFSKNFYFAAAEKDFSEAVERTSCDKSENNCDQSSSIAYGTNYLMELYYKRAYALMYNSALSKTITSENKANVVLEDWDKYINYFKTRVGTENEMPNDGIYLKMGYELRKTAVSRLKVIKAKLK